MKKLYTAVEIFAISMFINLYGIFATLFMAAIAIILVADYVFNYME